MCQEQFLPIQLYVQVETTNNKFELELKAHQQWLPS